MVTKDDAFNEASRDADTKCGMEETHTENTSNSREDINSSKSSEEEFSPSQRKASAQSAFSSSSSSSSSTLEEEDLEQKPDSTLTSNTDVFVPATPETKEASKLVFGSEEKFEEEEKQEFSSDVKPSESAPITEAENSASVAPDTTESKDTSDTEADQEKSSSSKMIGSVSESISIISSNLKATVVGVVNGSINRTPLISSSSSSSSSLLNSESEGDLPDQIKGPGPISPTKLELTEKVSPTEMVDSSTNTAIDLGQKPEDDATFEDYEAGHEQSGALDPTLARPIPTPENSRLLAFHSNYRGEPREPNTHGVCFLYTSYSDQVTELHVKMLLNRCILNLSSPDTCSTKGVGLASAAQHLATKLPYCPLLCRCAFYRGVATMRGTLFDYGNSDESNIGNSSGISVSERNYARKKGLEEAAHWFRIAKGAESQYPDCQSWKEHEALALNEIRRLNLDQPSSSWEKTGELMEDVFWDGGAKVGTDAVDHSGIGASVKRSEKNIRSNASTEDDISRSSKSSVNVRDSGTSPISPAKAEFYEEDTSSTNATPTPTLVSTLTLTGTAAPEESTLIPKNPSAPSSFSSSPSSSSCSSSTESLSSSLSLPTDAAPNPEIAIRIASTPTIKAEAKAKAGGQRQGKPKKKKKNKNKSKRKK